MQITRKRTALVVGSMAVVGTLLSGCAANGNSSGGDEGIKHGSEVRSDEQGGGSEET